MIYIVPKIRRKEDSVCMFRFDSESVRKATVTYLCSDTEEDSVSCQVHWSRPITRSLPEGSLPAIVYMSFQSVSSMKCYDRGFLRGKSAYADLPLSY